MNCVPNLKCVSPQGFPLHIQVDTTDDLREGAPPIHRGYCQIKVFCDKVSCFLLLQFVFCCVPVRSTLKWILLFSCTHIFYLCNFNCNYIKHKNLNNDNKLKKNPSFKPLKMVTDGTQIHVSDSTVFQISPRLLWFLYCNRSNI